MKDTYKYALAILAVILICAAAFIVSPDGKFGGTDDAGTRAIKAVAPTYQRWAIPWWTPPPETESMLFALQAAIGGAIIGYYVGVSRGRKDEEPAAKKSDSNKP